MRYSFAILFLCLSYFQSQAQGFSIKGNVVDAQQQALPGAHIALQYPWGEIVKTAVSGADGSFSLEQVEKGGYKLLVSFLGYKDWQKEVTLSTVNIQLGQIVLTEASIELEEVEVKEKLPLATQLGDTTQYNANAFKTLKDASAEELIEKMPGVIIDNGKVQAQGEEVKEVLVDGRLFFGNDPTAALRNLPAEVIDKIQIFDQKSDQAQFSGFDDGETSKTINIITRSDKRNGQFGNVYAGYGYEGKYQLGGNVSLFDGNRRISIIGQSNNVNQQNFATEDLLGVVGSSGRQGRGRGGRGRGGRSSGRTSVNDFLVPQTEGIAQTHALGINYSDKWGEKLEISGSYFFNHSDNEASTLINREYIDLETDQEFYTEDNSSNSQNQNHRINAKLEYQINEKNSIVMRPRFSWQLNDGESLTFGQTMLNSELLNQTDNQYQSDLKGLSFSNNLLFRHRFTKARRTFSVNLGSSYDQKEGESFLYSENQFSRENDLIDTLDQNAQLDVKGWNYSTSFSYTEPLGERSMLMLSYRASLKKEDSDQQTFDRIDKTQSYDVLNESFSNIFSNDYWTHQIGSGYNYRKGRNFTLMARLSLQWAEQKNEEQFPQMMQLNRRFVNLLPFAMMRFRFSKQENLRIVYRSNTQAPTVAQVQNLVDNSNPLQLSVGNPELDQSYSHRLFARYSKNNIEKATVFYALISGTYTDNYISNRLYLSESDDPIFEELSLEPGAQLSQAINLDGYWNLRSFLTYGFPVTALKSNLSLDLSANYIRNPAMIEEQINYSNNQSLAMGISLSSNISDKIDFTISTRSSLNDVQNSLQTNLNNQYWNQKSRIKLGWVLPRGIVIRTELNHQLYDGLMEEIDPNYWLWNAAIGKKLFKDQRAEISLSVFDILSQNQSISRNINEIYIEDTQSQVLQRYVMLNFRYNFRNFNTGKQKDPEQKDSDMPRFMRG